MGLTAIAMAVGKIMSLLHCISYLLLVLKGPHYVAFFLCLLILQLKKNESECREIIPRMLSSLTAA